MQALPELHSRPSGSSRVKLNMAPIRSNTSGGMDRGDNCSGVQSDRKLRKPLVERKRRARINESLQELRVLIADANVKMENAEVLERTVTRVESILQNRALEVDAVNREARERFAAGYIHCMQNVHTFMSSSQGIDPSVATGLLNHLLESIPLKNEDRLRVMLSDFPGKSSNCSVNESLYWALMSPAPSTSSSDDHTDLDGTESEQSLVSSSGDSNVLCLPSNTMWRPW